MKSCSELTVLSLEHSITASKRVSNNLLLNWFPKCTGRGVYNKPPIFSLPTHRDILPVQLVENGLSKSSVDCQITFYKVSNNGKVDVSVGDVEWTWQHSFRSIDARSAVASVAVSVSPVPISKWYILENNERWLPQFACSYFYYIRSDQWHIYECQVTEVASLLKLATELRIVHCSLEHVARRVGVTMMPAWLHHQPVHVHFRHERSCKSVIWYPHREFGTSEELYVWQLSTVTLPTYVLDVKTAVKLLLMEIVIVSDGQWTTVNLWAPININLFVYLSALKKTFKMMWCECNVVYYGFIHELLCTFNTINLYYVLLITYHIVFS